MGDIAKNLGEMCSHIAVVDKQADGKEDTKLKEKHGNNIATYTLRENPMHPKMESYGLKRPRKRIKRRKMKKELMKNKVTVALIFFCL